MKLKKTEYVLYFFTFISLVIGIILLPFLPDKIATHWNQFGIADGFSSKIIGILVIPISILVLSFIYSLVSRTDYIKKDKKLIKPLDWVVMAATIFLMFIGVISLIWNLGYEFNMSNFVIPPTGLIFFLVGYLLLDVKQNYFFGIRNAWTLKSKVCWQRTHFVSGLLFIVLSLVLLFGFFYIDLVFLLLLLGVIAISMFSLVYAYIIYTNEKEKKIKLIPKKVINNVKKACFYLFIICVIVFLALLIFL